MKTHQMNNEQDRNDYQADVTILFEQNIKTAGGAQNVAWTDDTLDAWMSDAPTTDNNAIAREIASQVFAELNDRAERIFTVEDFKREGLNLYIHTWKSNGKYQSCTRASNGMSGVLIGTSQEDALNAAMVYASINL